LPVGAQPEGDDNGNAANPNAAAAAAAGGAAAAAAAGGTTQAGRQRRKVSASRIHFHQHINKSVKSTYHRRRMTVADLTPNIQTPEEEALWDNLYFMHTRGSRTNWAAFCAEWSQQATMHKHAGSAAIKHKQVHQLQRYHDKMVKETLSQTHALAGMPMQAGQPQQPQQQQQAGTGSAAADAGQQYSYQQQQHHQHAAGFDATAAAAAAAGSGMYAGGFDYSQMIHQQQMYTGVHGMPYMAAGSTAGLYGMSGPPMGAAAAAGGFVGGLGSQAFGFQSFDPAAVEARQRALEAYRLKKQQRPQPVSQPPRVHRPHRCNKCWRPLAGGSKQHKNGKDDWAKGERCEGDCANCHKPMRQHDQPCPDPERK